MDESDDLHVVGDTGNSDETLGLVEGKRPDLVLLGLNVAGKIDGIRACQAIKALPEAPRVLVHSSYNFCDDVSSCLLAGADGYLHKSVSSEDLVDAVRRVATGERVWKVGGRIGEPRSRVYRTPSGNRLTPKEREIIVLMFRDYSNVEMADALYLSLPTVKSHVRNILRKLDAKSRTELFLRYHSESSRS